MSTPRYINASHRAVEVRAEARALEQERILREEHQRDERRRAAIEADRRAAGIVPPTSPTPQPSKPPKPKPVQTPRRAVSNPSPPPAPVVPPGKVLVDADVLDALLATSPLTKDVTR